MILYHFCADRHVNSIMSMGLTRGCVTELKPDGLVLHNGWTWLTLSGNPGAQSWAKKQMPIPYGRTAWRVTIKIPDEELDRLYDRKRLTELLPSTNLLFRGFEGSEEWRVFKGCIPAEWIIRAERMDKSGKEAEPKYSAMIEQLPGQLDMFGDA